jgi:hypothetical protein
MFARNYSQAPKADPLVIKFGHGTFSPERIDIQRHLRIALVAFGSIGRRFLYYLGGHARLGKERPASIAFLQRRRRSRMLILFDGGT